MPSNIVAALIMKDEASIAARCLTAIKPHVSSILVADTGSRDDTMLQLEAFGALVRQDLWHDFATNRNLVLHAAEDLMPDAHILCGIDADEILHVPEGYEWPELVMDGYYIQCRYGNIIYNRMALVRSHMWEWRGVIHEALVPLVPSPTTDVLYGPWIEVRSDGARARNQNTQVGDLTILQNAVDSDPTNARYQFYLAQTYKDLGMLAAAFSAYIRRAEMQHGWVVETAYALYQAGAVAERLGHGDPDLYMRAFHLDPTRAEPLVALARWYRIHNNLTIAALFANIAVGLPRPTDGLFVENDVYEWRALDELVAVGYYTGMRDAATTAARALKDRAFPAHEKMRILDNCKHYL